MARLGDVCIINPKVPPIDDSMLVSFVPMQRVGEEGEFDPSEQRTYADVKKGFTYFADADVLFAKITPCMENGKGAIACGMENGIGFGSTEFHVLRPNKKMMMGEWLYYLTVCPTFRKEAERNMTGSAGQKRVPKSFLENYHVNIPVLSEQHQQVQVLNNIFALLSLRKQQLAKLDELVKSRFMEQFGCYLGDEPRCATVEQVCTVFADGDWIESKDQADDGIRLIQTGNVGNGVYLDKGERARYIDEETFARLNCTEVLPNDILISRLPDPVGRACIIPDGLGKTITAVDCSIVRLKRHVLPEFFVAYTMTTLYAAQIGSSVTGSTRKRISRKNLGQVVIPTPDIDQQEQFAAFVRQSDKSKLAVQQSIDQLETLKKSLMQKYFG